jgi:tetratricopeptide (TPR) repeat protein
MKRACLVRSASLLLVLAASACAADERPPSVSTAQPSPSPPVTRRPAVTFSPLPASVRDERRFPGRSRALIVTELQGLEASLAASPAGAPERPALMHRLAEGYSELERAAEADRDSAPPGIPEAVKAGEIAALARKVAIKYYLRLAQQYAQWCAAPPNGCADESLYYVALAFERAGQLDDARKVHLDLIQSWPASRYIPFAFLAFGELFLEAGQRDPSKLRFAEQAYAEVSKYPPPHNHVYGYSEYRLGQVYAWQGDNARALVHLQKATAYAEGSGDAALGALVAQTRRDLGAGL